MNRLITGVLAALLLLFPTISCTSSQTTIPATTVLSVKVSNPPVLDGQADSLWGNARAITIPVTGGVNSGSTGVSLKSVYTSDKIFFLAQWSDPTESLERTPWEKQADGIWKMLTTSNTHQENTYYEDKLSLIWNIGDSIANFNQQGCIVACHAGEIPANSGFGSKYTANPGEIGDLWHWKAVRTNPVAQVDDQYVDSMRYNATSAPEAGRHSDPKTGGGYVNNESADKKLPAYGLRDNKPAPPYWIMDGEKVSFNSASYGTGQRVPSIVVDPFTGDRADITGKANYQNGLWTLEWGRALVTGSQYDVQFNNLAKEYYFGLAAFDNAQVNHAWSAGAYQLKFK